MRVSLLLLVLLTCVLSEALRLTGSWNTESFFLFLAKFGFQRTRSANRRDTEGHIFGNITARGGGSLRHPATLAVLDRSYFIDYYTNRSWPDRDAACRAMFAVISTIAYDARCFDDGEEDFLRRVPCPGGRLCPDEDAAANVVSNYQFTYAIRDINQPR